MITLLIGGQIFIWLMGDWKVNTYFSLSEEIK